MIPKSKHNTLPSFLTRIAVDFNEIYSSSRRIVCHTAFWFLLLSVYTIDIWLINDAFTFNIAFVLAFRQISQSLLLFYFVSYFVIPKLFLKGRYTTGVLALCFPFLMATTIDFLTFKLFNPFLLNGKVAKTYIELGVFVKDFNSIFNREHIILSIMPVTLRTLPAFIVKLLVSVVHFFSEAADQRKKQHELEMSNLQLEVNFLKAQMNPHYLFNTLNQIYTYTYLKDDRVLDLISDLSEVLSYTLYESKDTFVSLDKELVFLEHYLNLEKTRLKDYGASLSVNIDRQEAGDTQIVPLLLFPFVENAIKHGIESDKKSGWIDLRASVSEGKLSFYLKNSKGTYGSMQVAPDGKIVGGVGMAATQRRLDLLYPSNHELIISETDDTYTVHLTINCHDHEPISKLHYS